MSTSGAGHTWADLPRADAIVAAVSHKQFVGLPVEDFQRKLIKRGCFIDVKACFDAKAFGGCGDSGLAAVGPL